MVVHDFRQWDHPLDEGSTPIRNHMIPRAMGIVRSFREAQTATAAMRTMKAAPAITRSSKTLPMGVQSVSALRLNGKRKLLK